MKSVTVKNLTFVIILTLVAAFCVIGCDDTKQEQPAEPLTIEEPPAQIVPTPAPEPAPAPAQIVPATDEPPPTPVVEVPTPPQIEEPQPKVEEPPPDTKECTTNADCSDDRVCTKGKCVAAETSPPEPKYDPCQWLLTAIEQNYDSLLNNHHVFAGKERTKASLFSLFAGLQNGDALPSNCLINAENVTPADCEPNDLFSINYNKCVAECKINQVAKSNYSCEWSCSNPTALDDASFACSRQFLCENGIISCHLASGISSLLASLKEKETAETDEDESKLEIKISEVKKFIEHLVDTKDGSASLTDPEWLSSFAPYVPAENRSTPAQAIFADSNAACGAATACDGTVEKPYKEIQDAIAAWKASKSAPPRTIVVKEGTYRRPLSIEGITGDQNSPYVIMAYPGDRPVINMAETVTGWETLSSSNILKKRWCIHEWAPGYCAAWKWDDANNKTVGKSSPSGPNYAVNENGMCFERTCDSKGQTCSFTQINKECYAVETDYSLWWVSAIKPPYFKTTRSFIAYQLDSNGFPKYFDQIELTQAELTALDNSGKPTYASKILPDRMRAGTFFLDRVRGILYVRPANNTNPIIEVSKYRRGIRICNSAYVQVIGLTFKHSSESGLSIVSPLNGKPGDCETPDPSFANDPFEPGFIALDDITVERNYTQGIVINGRNIAVRHALSRWNGISGLGSSGYDNIIEDSVFTNNNTERWKTTWHSGGIKTGGGSVHQHRIQRNVFAHNFGPGLWYDFPDQPVTADKYIMKAPNQTLSNIAYDNSGPGFFFEVVYGGLLANNISYNNRGVPPGWQRYTKGPANFYSQQYAFSNELYCKPPVPCGAQSDTEPTPYYANFWADGSFYYGTGYYLPGSANIEFYHNVAYGNLFEGLSYNVPENRFCAVNGRKGKTVTNVHNNIFFNNFRHVTAYLGMDDTQTVDCSYYNIPYIHKVVDALDSNYNFYGRLINLLGNAQKSYSVPVRAVTVATNGTISKAENLALKSWQDNYSYDKNSTSSNDSPFLDEGHALFWPKDAGSALMNGIYRSWTLTAVSSADPTSTSPNYPSMPMADDMICRERKSGSAPTMGIYQQ